MEKSILLTGGTGFIGSNLCESLLKLNRNIIILKRSFSNDWRIKDLKSKNSNLTLINIDEINLKNIFLKYNIEGILHLATYYKKYHEPNDINYMIESNITFPTNLLEYSVKNNVKYFINTGTFFEYPLNKLPITEFTSNKSFNLYSATKLAFENILNYYTDNFELKTATLKLFTPYGPKDNENKLIPYLILNILKGNDIKLNNPSQTLDPVFVDDISNAFIKSIENYKKFNDHEVFNIASGVTYNVNDIFEIIKSKILKNNKMELSNDLNQICKSNKALNILNWKSETNLVNGIDLTINYYNNKYDIRSDL